MDFMVNAALTHVPPVNTINAILLTESASWDVMIYTQVNDVINVCHHSYKLTLHFIVSKLTFI